MGARAVRLILDQETLEEGLEALLKLDPRFKAAHSVIRVTLRRQSAGFETLLWAIVGQQVSVVSAEAVWSRLQAAGMVTPSAILAAGESELGRLGLTRQKQQYALSLAKSRIDFNSLDLMSDVEVFKALTAIKGIGPWTAEIYMMFALGRPDVIAAGDLAMQAAAQELFELDRRPSEKELRSMAEAWAPWRAVAGRLLWDYYLRDRSKGDSR